MPFCVRPDPPGFMFFFTARAASAGTCAFVAGIDALRIALRRAKLRYPFEIEEIVVLEDVIHTVWTLPCGDAEYLIRWHMVQNLFSRAIEVQAQNRAKRPGETDLWQRRVWARAVKDADDLAAYRHMIWAAPVQAGYVKRPEQWPYSSIHRAVWRGVHELNQTAHSANLPPEDRTVRARDRREAHA